MTAHGPRTPMVTFIAANELPQSMEAVRMAAVGQNVPEKFDVSILYPV